MSTALFQPTRHPRWWQRSAPRTRRLRIVIGKASDSEPERRKRDTNKKRQRYPGPNLSFFNPFLAWQKPTLEEMIPEEDHGWGKETIEPDWTDADDEEDDEDDEIDPRPRQ